jgi:hypothetical protein
MVINGDYRCMASAAVRVLNVDILSTTFYQDLDLPELVAGANDPTYALESPVVLYATEGATVPAIENPFTNDGIYTVEFIDGLEIDMKPSSFMGTVGGMDALRSARTSGSLGGLDFVGGVNGFEGFYGFWPEADVSDNAGYVIRIPNSTGLASGTRVDFYVLGGLSTTDLSGEKIGEGEWKKVSTGTVVGMHIVSDHGAGIPCLTWLGYRAQ